MNGKHPDNDLSVIKKSFVLLYHFSNNKCQLLYFKQ